MVRSITWSRNMPSDPIADAFEITSRLHTRSRGPHVRLNSRCLPPSVLTTAVEGRADTRQKDIPDIRRVLDRRRHQILQLIVQHRVSTPGRTL